MNVKHILKLKLEGIVYVIKHPLWIPIKYFPWCFVERHFSEETIDSILYNKPDSYTPRLKTVFKYLIARKEYR